MVREEWRLHSRLFGGRGFAAFPLVITALAGATYFLLVVSGFSVHEVQHGLHYLVVFLGLNVGSVGFVSRDAVQNLLGESNLLIFTSRTQPVSRRRIVATFLVKDLLYYSFLYLTPLVLALVPVAVYAGESPWVAVLVWVTLTASFALGVSLSFLGAALYTRGRTPLLAGAALLGVLITLFRFDLLVLTPVAFYLSPGAGTALGLLTPLPLAAAGLYVLRTAPGPRSRTMNDRYEPLNRWLGNGLVTKMVLDVLRSSGGVLKLLVSLGVLFGLFVFLEAYIPLVGGIVTSPSLSLAVVLAASSVSVYHWINMFDEASEYLVQPVGYGDVVHAKMVVHHAFALPMCYLYLAVGAVLMGSEGLVLGTVALPPLVLYVYGVAVYLTGLDPDDLLLDAGLFSVFFAAVSVVVLPLFVASFTYTLFPVGVAAFTLAVSFMAGLAGYLLHRRAAG